MPSGRDPDTAGMELSEEPYHPIQLLAKAYKKPAEGGFAQKIPHENKKDQHDRITRDEILSLDEYIKEKTKIRDSVYKVKKTEEFMWAPSLLFSLKTGDHSIPDTGNDTRRIPYERRGDQA